MDQGMVLSPTNLACISCYSDANFASCYGHEDSQDPHCACSCTGFVVLVFGCPVFCKSKLQTEIAMSTMEAKYVALSMACKDPLPLVALIRNLSTAVGLSSKLVSKIHMKICKVNSGALQLANMEPKHMTPCSKHYAIKYHWFHSHVSDKSNWISIVKIDTKNQLGDLFTKGLTHASFSHLWRLLMG
ncbi:hypothetical protein ACHAW6_014542 [Cyclotella cf. meneghiniana]